jgi:hypothetical protein
MEEIPLTRTYLESLATGDLIKMADDLGLDILDNPDRVFVIEELLETYSRDRNDSQEQETADSLITETVPLSKHYNISFIEVMIRDPLWAFVFWEIKASDEEQFGKAQDFNGYYLKISPFENPDNLSQCKNNGQKTDGVFTIPVKSEDSARYLSLTNTTGDETSWAEQCQYKVEFCANIGDAETVLAVSNPVRLPGQSVLPMDNQLARMSGYGDFQILRRSERLHRAKGPACE